MNQFVAILRRVSAVLAAVALLSSLAPAHSRAQGDARPAAPADSTANDSATPKGKKAKKTKAPRVPKPPKQKKISKRSAASDSTATAATAKPKREKAAKVPKVAKPKKGSRGSAMSDSTGTAATAAPKKAPKPPKAPKVAKTQEPEKSYEEQKKEDGVYAKRSNWLSFRFGYAKRSGDLTGDGLVGYGIGFQHMLSRKYAFAAGAGQDIVGHFGGQLDEAVPFTGEFQRHYKWNTAVRPYVGIGGGFYLRKTYRTQGEYNTTTTGGPHLSLGFTSALDERHVIGFEARVASLKGRPGIVNPTFGPGEDTETIWTAKLIWALVY
ncbi:MAG TPA: hypothetical protein VI504_01500 [Candidatus Eisenbacteria bacterium]